MVSFDLAYLGECHLFRGEAREARAAFARALGLGRRLPGPVRRMVQARAVLLAALRGRSREARAAGPDPSAEAIPYLRAWDRLYLGWAHRLLRRWRLAEEELEEARSFFARARVPAGEVHAQLELAGLWTDRGKPAVAEGLIRRLRSRWTPGRGALQNPMLAARFLLYQARLLLDRSPPDAEGAGSLLAEAEGYLIGRSLRDLERLARELRRRLEASGFHHYAASREASPPAPGVPLPPRGARSPAGSLIGDSPALRSVVGQVRQVARTPLSVLITGETGVGKELVARAIHQESPRAAGPFLTVNCAALPEGLLEAELFGYLRGAFSGAAEDRPGLLPRARGGTGLQAKLLRVLEHGAVRPLGASEETEVDARFLFATSRDLKARAEEGRFRRDLYFRLNVFQVNVPPLRERLTDLPALVEHFRTTAGGARAPVFDGEALRALSSHPWPGNVRELANTVTRLVLTRTGTIGASEVRSLLGSPAREGFYPPQYLRSRPLPELTAELEREYLRQLHADRGGDLEAMAAALGITVRALYVRFRRLGLRLSSLARD